MHERMDENRNPLSDLESYFPRQFQAKLTYFLGSITLLGLLVDLGKNWDRHGEYFWFAAVLAILLFPSWIILTGFRLKELKRTRFWLVLIVPLWGICAIGAYLQSRVLSIIDMLMTMTVILLLIFLKPSADLN
jgi:tellurite resistance protein TehA-like permease